MLTDQLVQAFSWTLIHSLWQGLLLSVITGGVLMLTKRSPSAIRYNLIFLQLLLFITGCIFTFTWEWQQYQLHTLVQPFDFLHLQADNLKQYTQTVISYFSANAPVVLLLWFILFIARAVKMMGGLVYIRRARYKNIYSPEDYWKEKIVLLCKQLQLKKAVTLFESGYVKMPLVIGHFKPVILIPAGLLAGLPASQIEAVLLHELAHIRRNDYFVNLLQNITEAIFFFNPGLLWISSLLRDEREHCCDDVALAQTKNKREFIEALISFKEHSNNYAVAFPGKKNHLLQRVSRIIHNKNNTLNPVEKLFFMTGILILAMMVTAAGMMQVRTIVKEKTEQKEITEQQEKSVARHKEIKPAKEVRERTSVPPQAPPIEAEEAKKDIEQVMHEKEQAIRDKEQAQRDHEQAVKDREQADKDRIQAEKDRAQADRDRAQADIDRAQAHRDREQADRDRMQADKLREQADRQPQ
jgi:beta-lactamase regulating signal transducer with metallopeptidase domain